MTRMDSAKCIVLHLLTENVRDVHHLMQKQLYLLQELGVNLGFRYIWWTTGPYSDDVTEFWDAHRSSILGRSTDVSLLQPSVVQAVETVRELTASRPTGLPLYWWLVLLASMRYVSTHPGFTDRSAADNIKCYLPLLLPYVGKANAALKEAGLMPA